VTPGTKVNIINTPIKVSEEPGGVRGGAIKPPPSKKKCAQPQNLPHKHKSAIVKNKKKIKTQGTRNEAAQVGRLSNPTQLNPQKQ
ncbi:L,D-transpeptidase, partial [Enterobacter sichuanensis]